MPREEIVVTVKIFFYEFPIKNHNIKVNSYGLSRKHLIEGTKKSLANLQLDYADIIFAHRYDPDTPMEEVCRGFDWIIN